MKLITVKYLKEVGDRQKKMSEIYLIDGELNTEAEANFAKVASDEIGTTDYHISVIRDSKLDVLSSESEGEILFELQAELTVFDEETGNEKPTKQNFILAADDIAQSIETLAGQLDGIDFRITMAKESKVVSVLAT